MKVKYLFTKSPFAKELGNFPSFSSTGSIRGMKDRFYGKNALLVQSGSFIYNVSRNPQLYRIAK